MRASDFLRNFFTIEYSSISQWDREIEKINSLFGLEIPSYLSSTGFPDPLDKSGLCICHNCVVWEWIEKLVVPDEHGVLFSPNSTQDPLVFPLSLRSVPRRMDDINESKRLSLIWCFASPDARKKENPLKSSNLPSVLISSTICITEWTCDHLVNTIHPVVCQCEVVQHPFNYSPSAHHCRKPACLLPWAVSKNGYVLYARPIFSVTIPRFSKCYSFPCFGKSWLH